MRRSCFFHAGCPDGFGAAWAVWRAWGTDARYIARGHDDGLCASDFEDEEVVFVDIAPPCEALRELGELAERVVVLDHHVSARDAYTAEPDLAVLAQQRGHEIRFDLEHSGAVLAWQHFHPQEPVPQLLQYVEDQDLWRWKLPHSEEVNAAIGSHPREFEVWEELAAWPIESLVAEGTPILRSNRIEVQRLLESAHPLDLAGLRVEAVNASQLRSLIGHELATRAAYGTPLGAVYRLSRRRVDVSLYSVGELDVARIASAKGGGGHRNAAGFSVSLQEWLDEFVV